MLAIVSLTKCRVRRGELECDDECENTLRSRTHKEEASCGRAEVVGPRRGEATRASLSGSRRGGRVRSTCKECGFASCQQAPEEKVQGKTKGVRGSGLHQREKSRSKECGASASGASARSVGVRALQCKDCEGRSCICPHQRGGSRCKECGGGEHLPASAREEQVQGVRGGEHLPAPVHGSHLSSADKELSDFESLLPIRQNI